MTVGREPQFSKQPARRPRRLLLRAFLTACIAGIGALAASFLWFISGVSNDEIELDRNADGIVVLTGGASRVADAVELLAAGRGRRLLITGVNPATGPGGLSRVVPLHDKVITCCVDLDHSAVNTVGNAVETRRWARQRGFRSLIVVTSNYHMPRALAELSHQLPDVTLIPFPVVTEKRRAEPWWSNAASARLLFSEYLKYIYSVVRHRLDPGRDDTEVARGRNVAAV
jgi:uncharacterized SAM-binding protein YcdF (DUF218 family)